MTNAAHNRSAVNNIITNSEFSIDLALIILLCSVRLRANQLFWEA